MIKLYARKNELIIKQKETLTSGSVNVNEVEFTFSGDWNGLTRTAVFRAGDESREVALGGTGRCSMPWEVLAKAGREVEAGVYGSASGGEIVLPTVWASLGKVLEGTVPGEGARPPTPDLWEQELANKQDKLKGEPGQIVGFDEAGNAVPQENTGGAGTADHNKLTNRDMANQHPIESITGLEETLETIPAPLRRITNKELEEMLT